MKSLGLASLFFLGFALLETAVFSNIMIFPSVPDFMLIVSLYFSLNNGKLFGTAAGFISGLILDFFSASPFGLNCLFRTIFGYVTGIFNKSVNESGIFFPFILGFISTLFKALILWVISLFYPSINLDINLFSINFGFELFANSFFTPLIFRFMDIFKNSIVINPEKVS